MSVGVTAESHVQEEENSFKISHFFLFFCFLLFCLVCFGFVLFSLWEMPEYALALVEVVIRAQSFQAVMLSVLSRPPAPQLPLPVLEWGVGTDSGREEEYR